jgi:hypothetical protein
MSEQPKVAIATITLDEGAVDIGLNRGAAEDLVQKLQLFLQDWPKDQSSALN